MQIKYVKTVIDPQTVLSKITALTWSPNNIKLAICNAERTVFIADDKGEIQDKFATKPIDSKYGKKSYVVKAMAFSPDSTKLAVGQSDNIVFVYKLSEVGDEWTKKKSIICKFIVSSAVTALVWPLEGPIIFGLADGVVKAASLKSSKTQTLYSSQSYVVSICSNPKGTAFLSGHADGSVFRCYVSDSEHKQPLGKILVHNVPPYAMCWTGHFIIIGGCDRKVVFYDSVGKVSQQFDYSHHPSEKEFTAAVCSPSGQTVVLGSFDRLRSYGWLQRKNSWEETKPKEIENIYTIAALAWKRDGSKIACGTLCGGVFLFDSVLRKSVKGNWEMTYVGPSQVLIKPKSGGKSVNLKSQYGFEIEDVKILGRDRYIMGRTTQTLLLGDLEKKLLSEIQWSNTGGQEKFFFDFENVCLVFNAGELTLVEYGSNEILGSVRTEYMNPHLISVRLNERTIREGVDNKKMAYLLDLRTIRIVDLTSAITICDITHDTKVDWLELNGTGKFLLFRDKTLRLNLVDIDNQQRSSILHLCTFVQWVPGSDVVVAQSRQNLCVWYNIDQRDQPTEILIKGNVLDIERVDGRTDVVIEDGPNTERVSLDENLIEFGTAIDDGNYDRALMYLESQSMSHEAEAMWRTLGTLALQAGNLYLAERCYAALGDVAKARFLKETRLIGEEVTASTGIEGYDHYEVQARLALLDKQFQQAEALYLEHNQLDKAMAMYQKLNKWEDALRLAEFKNHPELENLRNNYFQWLQQTAQEETAGMLKENEGDYMGAVNLYLKAGLPARAAKLILTTPEMNENPDIISRVIMFLVKYELFERAGDLYEHAGDITKALEMYRKGNSYAKAIEIARESMPSEIVSLEEEWGDYLVSGKQLDAAVNHYIEAGRTMKALDSAVNARQWKRASQILNVVDDKTKALPYYEKLGQHFSSVQDYKSAEGFYLSAGMYREAIDMYNEAEQWELAHRIASQYMDPEEVTNIYISQANKLEEQMKFKDAEKVYISVNEPDLAITMYKKNKQYDNMMRLVTQYHPDLVKNTHLHLAKELSDQGSYRQAEMHYLKVDDWKNAVNMYRTNDMWEDAYRVAKSAGGPAAARQVAFFWARFLGGDSAVKLLTKFGLLEQAIDWACESYYFDFAFELGQNSMQEKLPDVYNKHAMALEDEGKFDEAENEFIKANKPKEAILMYIHNKDWSSALRVAENNDPESLNEVLISQAKEAFQQKNFQLFESLLLRAEKPETALRMYKEQAMWQEAITLCREYMPSELQSVQDQYESEVLSRGQRDFNTIINQGKEWEKSGEYNRAIDCYLGINEKHTQDYTLLMKVWTHAAQMAIKFVEEKAVNVVSIAAPKLLGIKQYNQAAQLYLSVDKIREAVNALVSGEEWSKAKRVAKEFDPQLELYVDNKYKDFLKSQGHAEQLTSVDVIEGLDMYAEQGEWKRCLEVAERHGPLIVEKYAALYGSHLIKENKPLEALNLYSKYGPTPNPQSFNIYRRLCVDIFGLRGLEDSNGYSVWSLLRNLLFNICENLSHSNDAFKEFERLLFVSHYFAIRSVMKNMKGLDNLVTKVSISLLRYCDLIPADKCFYEAGRDAKAVGWANIAFVFLNRYLDVSEAMEEANEDLIDIGDLASTDIPHEFPLPANPFLTPEEHDDIKEWILAVSMDQKIEQELPLDERGVFESSLLGASQSQAQPCVITGYPVLRNAMEFKHPGRAANKDDWNKFVICAKQSNHPNVEDQLKFIDQFCGGIPSCNYSFT